MTDQEIDTMQLESFKIDCMVASDDHVQAVNDEKERIIKLLEGMPYTDEYALEGEYPKGFNSAINKILSYLITTKE